MKKILIALAGVLAANANAFVLMGPTDLGAQPNIEKSTELAIAAAPWSTSSDKPNSVQRELVDDLGTPKRIDEFYRWNTPNLTYGFDASFVRFFGEQGIAAVTRCDECVE